MTPQEIIKENQKLPLEQKKEVLNSFADEIDKPLVTEEEFLEILLSEGIISEIPLREYDEEEETFEPIEVKGEPLSEMIIRERR